MRHGTVPEGAVTARLGIGVDDPNFKSGEKLLVSRVSVSLKTPGSACVQKGTFESAPFQPGPNPYFSAYVVKPGKSKVVVEGATAPDADGVRIAELNEDSYKFLLWDHRPLTDFWMIGAGKANRLQKAYMYTMGEVARRSLYDEEWFYKAFGVDAEILLAHAWGEDPVSMQDIKNYRSDTPSVSPGQVLPRPYAYDEARTVFSEMIDSLCADLFCKTLISPGFSWWVSYDWQSLEKLPFYDGPVCLDFDGKPHPKHTVGRVKMPVETNSPEVAASLLLASFDEKTDHRLLYRRLGICAENVRPDIGFAQVSFFVDYESLEREKHLQQAMHDIRAKYGANSVFLGKNLREGATQLERNMQIGGHRA